MCALPSTFFEFLFFPLPPLLCLSRQANVLSPRAQYVVVVVVVDRFILALCCMYNGRPRRQSLLFPFLLFSLSLFPATFYTFFPFSLLSLFSFPLPPLCSVDLASIFCGGEKREREGIKKEGRERERKGNWAHGKALHEARGKKEKGKRSNAQQLPT